MSTTDIEDLVARIRSKQRISPLQSQQGYKMNLLAIEAADALESILNAENSGLVGDTPEATNQPTADEKDDLLRRARDCITQMQTDIDHLKDGLYSTSMALLHILGGTDDEQIEAMQATRRYVIHSITEGPCPTCDSQMSDEADGDFLIRTLEMVTALVAAANRFDNLTTKENI